MHRACVIRLRAAADFIMGVYLLLVGTTDVIYRDQYNRYALSWMDSWCCQTAGFLAVLSCEVGTLSSLPVMGTVRHRHSKEASILWSHHEETRELPGERENARNNARCTQARKATHGLDGQHQDVDRTPRGEVSQNDKGQR